MRQKRANVSTKHNTESLCYTIHINLLYVCQVFGVQSNNFSICPFALFPHIVCAHRNPLWFSWQFLKNENNWNRRSRFRLKWPLAGCRLVCAKYCWYLLIFTEIMCYIFCNNWHDKHWWIGRWCLDFCGWSISLFRHIYESNCHKDLLAIYSTASS